jgi:hypothetical protein
MSNAVLGKKKKKKERSVHAPQLQSNGLCTWGVIVIGGHCLDRRAPLWIKPFVRAESYSPHPYTLRRLKLLVQHAARQSADQVLVPSTEFSHKVQCHWVQCTQLHHIVRVRGQTRISGHDSQAACCVCRSIECSWLARVVLFFWLQYHHFRTSSVSLSSLCS